MPIRLKCDRCEALTNAPSIQPGDLCPVCNEGTHQNCRDGKDICPLVMTIGNCEELCAIRATDTSR